MDQQVRPLHDEFFPGVAPQPDMGWNMYDSVHEHHAPHQSPAPTYRSHHGSSPLESPPVSSASPLLSSITPPPCDVGIARSPSRSDRGWKSNTQDSSAQYSEFLSPDPERVYHSAVFPVYHVPPPEKVSLASRHSMQEKEYCSSKVSPINPHPTFTPDQQRPSMLEETSLARDTKRPIYKRPLCILVILIVTAAIVAGVACGVVFGVKNSKKKNATTIHGDPNLAVGGYLSDSYYSTTGAFNGSGIALAAANPGVDQTIYIFYQDYLGDLQWKLMRADGTYSQPLGVINEPSSRPMNGTPLSIVNLQLNATTLTYHLFYIDSNYMINERVLQTGGAVDGSVVPVWSTGALTSQKLTTMKAESIGLQACPWLDYYGAFSPANHSAPTLGLHLWYADSETSFQQYDWMNGSSSWKQSQQWSGMDGHAGVGCQTWESQTEYVFFVDTNQEIAMFWKDNNRSTEATTSHPLEKWVKVANVDIDSVGRSSSLGYTLYMLYQDENAAIRGANISWAAENTTIAISDSSGSPDIFTIEDLNSDDPVAAIRGTHMCITELKTASGGAELQIIFQQSGDDVSIYTRDVDKVNGAWQRTASVV